MAGPEPAVLPITPPPKGARGLLAAESATAGLVSRSPVAAGRRRGEPACGPGPSSSSDSHRGGPTARPVTARRMGAWALPSCATPASSPAATRGVVDGGGRPVVMVGVARWSRPPARPRRPEYLRTALSHSPESMTERRQVEEVGHGVDLGQGAGPLLHLRRPAAPSGRRSQAWARSTSSAGGSARRYSALTACSLRSSKMAPALLTSSRRNSAIISSRVRISRSPPGDQPEQGQVVAHRLGQVALVPVVLHGHLVAALGELLAGVVVAAAAGGRRSGSGP